ncbi:hypothetical protein [Deinococcus cellulosilyticus]|uniref:Uncharacterized protein n=1 Tax=Deinococcus cellulosilyticus (strain DSM 18568 / NBRC 106333 / KACC 11606 / 5516J-15) TaxID=1223518 RepID=A0A511N9Q1_DEIC1|nr:hypothetical protein [Deinococcus cellulosilyticus]GEM49559.1 hypothetical protein DC3_51940 [Deinococcus cellulosilyticus NBRC 106333 = KACC 11606]
MQRTLNIDLFTYLIMLGLAGALFGSLFEWEWMVVSGPILVIAGFAGISRIESKVERIR